MFLKQKKKKKRIQVNIAAIYPAIYSTKRLRRKKDAIGLRKSLDLLTLYERVFATKMDMNLTTGNLNSSLFGHTGYQGHDSRRQESVSPASFLQQQLSRSDSTLFEQDNAENAQGELSDLFAADHAKHEKHTGSAKHEQVEADFLGLSNYFGKPFPHPSLSEPKPHIFFDICQAAAEAAQLTHGNAIPQAEANNGAAGRPKLIINTNFDERTEQQNQQYQMKMFQRSLSAQMVTPCSIMVNSMNGLGLQPSTEAPHTAGNESLTSPVSAGGALRRRRTEHSNFLEGPGFHDTIQLHDVYSLDLSMQFDLKCFPKVDRGFFMTQSNWTCYRRNYFQISGGFNGISRNGMHKEITLPAMLKLDDDKFVKVSNFAIGVSARTTSGESNVDIVQHTTKRDKGPIMSPQRVPVYPGGCPSSFMGTTYQDFVATFERLQFKVATANNGKKRAAQQFYTLVMELWAECQFDQHETGHSDKRQILVATCESSPLVVRGRSPAHYPDNNVTMANSGDLKDMVCVSSILSDLQPLSVVIPPPSPVSPAFTSKSATESACAATAPLSPVQFRYRTPSMSSSGSSVSCSTSPFVNISRYCLPFSCHGRKSLNFANGYKNLAGPVLDNLHENAKTNLDEPFFQLFNSSDVRLAMGRKVRTRLPTEALFSSSNRSTSNCFRTRTQSRSSKNNSPSTRSEVPALEIPTDTLFEDFHIGSLNSESLPNMSNIDDVNDRPFEEDEILNALFPIPTSTFTASESF